MTSKFSAPMLSVPVKRALLSVSNKDGIVELATTLINDYSIEIISTGGTAALLKQHHIPLIEVADYTGFPEMMDGRVKTLHPKIHGGLLGRHEQDASIMQMHDIPPIDLLIVNLYPFQQVIQKSDIDLTTAIENIDIGGPAMLRSGAKNYERVTVLVNPDDYNLLINELASHQGHTTYAFRFAAAQKVFAHTAQYDAAIAQHLRNIKHDTQYAGFSEKLTLQLNKKCDLRYGENPHQQAALYVDAVASTGNIAFAQQIQGKELSFNNIADADAALECVKSFSVHQPCCVIVKHANPCGAAIGATQLAAYQRAYATDPESSFGGIIAFNQTLTAETAQAILQQQFVEVIIAPAIDANAISILAEKPNIRVLICGQWPSPPSPRLEYRTINGGMLVQDSDVFEDDENKFKCVTKRKPTAQQLQDLHMAWGLIKHIKSNAIIYVKDNASVGIGAGQMSRIYSARIGAMKAEAAGLTTQDSILASDAFFPFRDTVDFAKRVGVSAIIQPGGSIRDEEVIAAADEQDLVMMFTHYRHFKH